MPFIALARVEITELWPYVFSGGRALTFEDWHRQQFGAAIHRFRLALFLQGAPELENDRRPAAREP